ncbi:TPA: glycosyltransferase family 2 protein [Candidatus Saccharibacteria bacterium]|nr:glycosyltransferase family 2 protein [Candidatus Saccharibacteria bacterium]HRK40542.1 glycosyltransferase family 2 protein [Candidatus Saccharibacteria bacterium]
MLKFRKKDEVAIVIPAYNESTQIATVVKGVQKSLKRAKFACTVIVVDDGSKDETAVAAKKAGAVVIRHILNTGAGGATATGLSYAEQNGFLMAATMDADGQHDPSDVVAGFKVLSEQNTDLLIGSRLIDSKGMSRVKVLGNRGLSFITYMLFGINSTDSQSGLRIFSRQALEQLRWKTSGYEFCSEMLWRAKQIGLTIDEYPIKAIYTDYSKAKGQNNWNAVNIIKSLLKRRVSELLG